VEIVRKKDKRVEERKVKRIFEQVTNTILWQLFLFIKKMLEERAQLAQQKAKERKEADRLKRHE
jgi:hypothetical protein